LRPGRSGTIAFTSLQFLFAWLPCAIAAFALVRRYRPALAPHVLLGASILFCAGAGWPSLCFLAASIVGNFAAAGVIQRTAEASAARRLAVAAAIIANLAPLLAFKLAEQLPAGNGVNAALAAIPIGLAFYTLQQVTFLVDIQRPDAVRLGFVRYAAWASFFGQLPAGPIAPYGRMAPQYALLGRERLAASAVARGLTLILAGIVKKMWLADPLGRKVDAVILGASVGGVTPLEAWTAAWGFLLQLYFDFSAYSDVAIGLGLCFGLRLPINFNSPLKAATPGQYILRWHISLMTFVRDYVFAPLFRLARRLPIRPTGRRYAIAWALSTLGGYLAVAAWHTLAPFVLMQGLAVTAAIVGFQFIRQRAGAARTPRPYLGRAKRLAGHVLLLMAASVTALCLRTGGDGALIRILPALFDLGAIGQLAREAGAHLASLSEGGGLLGGPTLYPNARLPGLWTLAMIAAASIVTLWPPNTMQMFGIAGASPASPPLLWRPTALWGTTTAILLLLAVMGVTRPVQQYAFIYAQF
jgi:alginate O-acetyltransferase complex protein AlgI